MAGVWDQRSTEKISSYAMLISAVGAMANQYAPVSQERLSKRREDVKGPDPDDEVIALIAYDIHEEIHRRLALAFPKGGRN
jgi:hypothetical protein